MEGLMEGPRGLLAAPDDSSDDDSGLASRAQRARQGTVVLAAPTVAAASGVFVSPGSSRRNSVLDTAGVAAPAPSFPAAAAPADPAPPLAPPPLPLPPPPPSLSPPPPAPATTRLPTVSAVQVLQRVVQRRTTSVSTATDVDETDQRLRPVAADLRDNHHKHGCDDRLGDDTSTADDVVDAGRLPSMSLLLAGFDVDEEHSRRHRPSATTSTAPLAGAQLRCNTQSGVCLDDSVSIDGPVGELGMDSVGNVFAAFYSGASGAGDGTTPYSASRIHSRRSSVVSVPRPRPQIMRRFSFPQNDYDVRWSAYLPQLVALSEPPRKSPLLQMLIRSGVPHNLRAQVWPIISGSKFIKASHEGEYQRLLEDNKTANTVFTRQIETDLHRTFPDRLVYNTEFLGENPRSVQRLRRVLCAYSFRNPGTGYCQGMNFLAASLLSIFDDEEDSFWMLATVIERLLPTNYYDNNLKGIKAEADLFEIIVAKELPRLTRHLNQLGIDMAMFTLEWFVSLFTMSFRPKMSLRIWDLFLYEGRVSLFCVALALVRVHEDKLLTFHTMDRLYDALKSLPSFNYDPNSIIQTINITTMAAMVKRLSFSIIQSQTLADTITSARQQPMLTDSSTNTAGGNRRPDSYGGSRKSPGGSPSMSRHSSNASSYRSFKSSTSLSALSQADTNDSDLASESHTPRKSASVPSTTPTETPLPSATPSLWSGFFNRMSFASSVSGSSLSSSTTAPEAITSISTSTVAVSVRSAPASPAAVLVTSDTSGRYRSGSGLSGGSAGGGLRRQPQLGSDDDRQGKDRRRTTKYFG